jgi:Cu-Zn family superoxide dismutase
MLLAENSQEPIKQIQTLPVKNAFAVINPTKGNIVCGVVHFRKVDGGVEIRAIIDGLTPGKHGFHIHEFGDCSAPDAASAGGHFNPTNEMHGGPDHSRRHAGDLGNLVANENGHAVYERIDSIINLNGPNSIVGRSVIIHSMPDDYTTQPTGNAGGRVGCGVIIENTSRSTLPACE